MYPPTIWLESLVRQYLKEDESSDNIRIMYVWYFWNLTFEKVKKISILGIHCVLIPWAQWKQDDLSIFQNKFNKNIYHVLKSFQETLGIWVSFDKTLNST